MPLSKRRHVDTSGTPDGTTRFFLCAPVERARTLSQSSWHEDDVLISGRSLSVPATFGWRIRRTDIRRGTIQFPHARNVRCLRAKTEGILPRSEVTMEVRRCQCAYHCRVQNAEATYAGETVASNLSKMCLGLATVLELSGGLRCVAACLSVFQCLRKCVPRQSQPLRLFGTVMASQNSVLGQESLISARALVRPGVVITYVSTSQLLAGKQYSSLGTGGEALVVAPRRSTDEPRTMLFTCKKVVRRARYAREK